MTDKTMENKRKNGINPVVAGVTGAVIGASVAVAGITVLRDKGNREKVKKKFIDARKQTLDYVKGIRKQTKDKKEKIEKQFKKDVKNTNKKQFVAKK